MLAFLIEPLALGIGCAVLAFSTGVSLSLTAIIAVLAALIAAFVMVCVLLCSDDITFFFSSETFTCRLPWWVCLVSFFFSYSD